MLEVVCHVTAVLITADGAIGTRDVIINYIVYGFLHYFKRWL